MRVVAGVCRGRALQSLPGEETRPTLNRVKEGMFSAVSQRVPGARVLDLYAGSGQLGLEALSRGAAFCHFIDSAPKAAELVRCNVENLGFSACCRVTCERAELFIQRCEEQFDLVLLDPPFGMVSWPGLLLGLCHLCTEGAEVLCETSREENLPSEVGSLRLKKQYRYGAVQVWRYANSQ